ncbi:MAG: UDP-glucose/GDP-mannose dehydrogenase family protein [Verrucomicrobiae bacterium]|nr:UDP-glucose/GDP-mannose dehydrogenase family protein [Verrucomicrobiae bacterium]
MNVAVLGLWHLGCVTAACCARRVRVRGLDFDRETVERLKLGHAPILEPGLDELLAAGLASGRLSFGEDPRAACGEADVLWVAYDTPVNDRDESDTAFVISRLDRCLPHLRAGAIVLVSSQLPAGTCRELERAHPSLRFACSPENLRLGKAIEAFSKAERIVVGTRGGKPLPELETLLSPFAPRILWMRTESAEMVKHGLNAFLALSIGFMNELATLCEKVGADAAEVSLGLKSEPRIGPKAYLRPGGAFAGGTLARDLVSLVRIAEKSGERPAIIPAVLVSNDRHRGWPFRQVQARLAPLKGKRMAVLGLTYTPNTDTLRRSAAVELCAELLAAGAAVAVFDPAVRELPPALRAVTLTKEAGAALQGAEAAVVCTEWPEFRRVPWRGLLPRMARALVVDANGFLEKEMESLPGVEYVRVGRSA